MVTSLKNTVLGKTPLKVQIRLPLIKFLLSVNLLFATYSTLYLYAIYATKKIRFFEPITRDDTLKRAPNRPKTQQSAGKVTASVFWDAHGIIFINYIPSERKDNY